jgi:CRISPR-associated protein Csm2
MEEIIFWKDKARRLIEPTLFSDQARKKAEDFYQDSQAQRGVNKRTQVRKFYDEIMALNNRVQIEPRDWENILPYIHMVIAKAAYADGRGLVSRNFVAFMESSIKKIQQPEDLELFANFFEAVMGFYRQYKAD